MFAIILVGLVVYLVILLKEIHVSQRQANFVDSVTHELKTPIASMKLYLDTLQMRDVDEQQRSRFYAVMNEDLNRLDQLITQLLEIGRLDAIVTNNALHDIEVEPLLRNCAAAVCSQHKQPLERVHFSVQPAVIRGVALALEIVFRNLLDNAVKYGATEPQVDVEVVVDRNNRVVTRIADNGLGVPADIRKKIFRLFFRGGNELERKKTGTGMGLYIVHTLVRRMKGKVNVYNRDHRSGAVFEVELPGRALPCAS
jgi:signal transduction histidine kinase